MERRRQWSFLLGDDGHWLWRAVDSDDSEASSEKSFATLKECTEDASRNGYVVWKSDDERRRTALEAVNDYFHTKEKSDSVAAMDTRGQSNACRSRISS